ncbi:MAG: glycoside hydrolase family 20 zincin-like fold domain-containing protein [Phycisphaerae bacterium]
MPTDELLVPVRRCRRGEGTMDWPKEPVLAAAADADRLPLEQLASDLRRLGLKPSVAPAGGEASAVAVIRDPSVKHPEGYRLTVGKDRIRVTASSDAGAYYGLGTLRDLLGIHGGAIPCCRIDDEPDFTRRGVYHDCSRGKVPTVGTLKQLIERLAHWKVNELQLYVENVFAFRRYPEIGRGYSPFTAEDFLELQRHCKRHHMRFVGSLASFGHMEKILRIPKFRRLAELPGFWGHPGGTTLCPTDRDSLRFVAELYEEFVPLFEVDDFNICCDETWELGRGRSRPRAEKIGVGRLYLEFLLELHKLCRLFDKRTNAWADIVMQYPELLGELPEELVLLNWEYDAGGERIARTAELADAGRQFVVCPGTSAWQSHGSRLDNAVANVSDFAAKGRRYGAEGLLNTDWGDNGHRNFLGVSLHGFAHGAAHAWHGRGVDDETFTERFCRQVLADADGQLARAMRRLGTTYRDAAGESGDNCALYHVLFEPLLPRSRKRSRIDAIDGDGLERIVGDLSQKDFVPRPSENLDDFEATAVRELAVAAEMDVLACRRAMIARRLRAGRRVRRTELRRLADDIAEPAEDFRRLWMVRNRASRLCENMSRFRRIEREARKGGA